MALVFRGHQQGYLPSPKSLVEMKNVKLHPKPLNQNPYLNDTHRTFHCHLNLRIGIWNMHCHWPHGTISICWIKFSLSEKLKATALFILYSWRSLPTTVENALEGVFSCCWWDHPLVSKYLQVLAISSSLWTNAFSNGLSPLSPVRVLQWGNWSHGLPKTIAPFQFRYSNG